MHQQQQQQQHGVVGQPGDVKDVALEPRHHSHPGDTLEDAHTVIRHTLTGDDVQITVGEDEPSKHAVESEISRIEGEDAGKPIKEYFDKWRGGIDTRVPIPSLQGLSVSWLGAFIG